MTRPASRLAQPFLTFCGLRSELRKMRCKGGLRIIHRRSGPCRCKPWRMAGRLAYRGKNSMTSASIRTRLSSAQSFHRRTDDPGKGRDRHAPPLGRGRLCRLPDCQRGRARRSGGSASEAKRWSGCGRANALWLSIAGPISSKPKRDAGSPRGRRSTACQHNKGILPSQRGETRFFAESPTRKAGSGADQQNPGMM